jgi:hypothetical protein
VLKPGGLCIATREHVLSARADLPAFLASHPLHALYGGENAYLLHEYTDALRAAGLSIRRILSPLESDINLYPGTVTEARERLAAKLKFPLPERFLNWLLAWRSRLSDTPGRLYTFVCARPCFNPRPAEPDGKTRKGDNPPLSDYPPKGGGSQPEESFR